MKYVADKENVLSRQDFKSYFTANYSLCNIYYGMPIPCVLEYACIGIHCDAWELGGGE